MVFVFFVGLAKPVSALKMPAGCVWLPGSEKKLKYFFLPLLMV